MTKAPKLTRKQIREGLDQVPMDTLILGTAAKHAGARLTPKQREFARLVALGESKAQSYRQAYKSKGNSKTAADNGHKLSKHTGIQQAAEAFAQAQRFAESHTPAQLRAFVVQQLTQHASNEDNPPAVRLKALELIGKHAEVGSFLDRKEVVTIKQSGDIRSRIMDRLKLIGASTTIEHNAEQDDAQDADSLLQELTATGADPQDADTTPPTTPLNEGVDGDKATHIIPHNQICDFSDTHTQFQSKPIPHNELGCVDAELVDSVSYADEGPSAVADTGELSTESVDKP